MVCSHVYSLHLFHRLARTAYLYNGCLPWYNGDNLTGPLKREIQVNSHSGGLVRWWNKCVKPLPVVVKVVNTRIPFQTVV